MASFDESLAEVQLALGNVLDGLCAEMTPELRNAFEENHARTRSLRTSFNDGICYDPALRLKSLLAEMDTIEAPSPNFVDASTHLRLVLSCNREIFVRYYS